MKLSDSVWKERRSGRIKHSDDIRSPFEVDYARMIHSGAFRRLQGKTQILSLGDDDFYRSRLTHSLEVAQVAEGIVQRLRLLNLPDEVAKLLPTAPLIQAVGLAHDIGHPPFGHGGELALNYCMRDHGGFEGNAQTLRLLTKLEDFSECDGADMTRRTLLGVIKYPSLYTLSKNKNIYPSLSEKTTTIEVLNEHSCMPVKACYDDDRLALKWIMSPLSSEDELSLMRVTYHQNKHGKTEYKSFDCSIMDISDDIAYGVHDLEDAIELGFVKKEHFTTILNKTSFRHFISSLSKRSLISGGLGDYDELLSCLFGSCSARKSAIGRLVHYLIHQVMLVEAYSFSAPILRWQAMLRQEARDLLEGLKALTAQLMIQSPEVQHLEFKGQKMVLSVFEAFVSSPDRLLPREIKDKFENEKDAMRTICDYIASFTDARLIRTYNRLFSPGIGSIFDRL